MSERLQKILARAGFGSRRKCEELIRCGRVTIDGRVATLGDKADPQVECVALDGHQVQPESMEYWLLNKPKGLISTASDPHGRPTVVDLSLIHISEPTRLRRISYAVFCLKK